VNFHKVIEKILSMAANDFHGQNDHFAQGEGRGIFDQGSRQP
jgi:hypothetical protein